VDLDEDLLTLEFSYRFHKEKVEEKKYREVVEKVLGSFAGAPIRIKGVLSEQRPEIAKEKPTEIAAKKEDIDPIEVFGKLD
jgi:hypothetical protein